MRIVSWNTAFECCVSDSVFCHALPCCVWVSLLRCVRTVLQMQFCNACSANPLILHQKAVTKKGHLVLYPQLIHFYPTSNGFGIVCTSETVFSLWPLLNWVDNLQLRCQKWVEGQEGEKQLVENFNMLFPTVSDINSPLTLEAKLKGVILLSSFCPLWACIRLIFPRSPLYGSFKFGPRNKAEDWIN